MNLNDIIRRQPVPTPWAEGEKIPWHEPGFSRRMLREHLTQAHDAASRRFPIIDEHVRWIHEQMLGSQPVSILDLGCGPGFYAHRLAQLGHQIVGIDFSPASVAYARSHAPNANCTFIEQDIRTADYGTDYALVMFIYGELNAFHPDGARVILHKAHQALAQGGRLLLEVSTFEAVRAIGQASVSWEAISEGLFSDAPHLCLKESFWDAVSCAATERYFVVDAATGGVTRHTASTQAYTEAQYRALLGEAGFGTVEFYPSLANLAAPSVPAEFVAIVAHKP